MKNQQPTEYFIVKDCFPLSLRTRQGHLPFEFNMVLEFIANAVRRAKETKGSQIGKKEAKLPIFTDGRREKILKIYRKLLELISKCRKFVIYRINVQKISCFSVYEQKTFQNYNQEYNCIVDSIIKSKVINLVIYLTKEIQDLCTKNYSPLLKGIKRLKI